MYLLCELCSLQKRLQEKLRGRRERVFGDVDDAALLKIRSQLRKRLMFGLDSSTFLYETCFGRGRRHVASLLTDSPPEEFPDM